MAASESGVLYSLLSLSASSVLLNVALLVWQLLRVHVERGFTFLKHALVLLSMAYILVAISVCFILLHMDTHSDVLCKAGGFLIIFASQETLWLLASASIGLYLWRKRTLSQDFQRWNKAIFYLVTIAQTIVILPISFLPFLNISYFNSVDEYYFHCTPLHLPNTEGWALSALVLVLDWVAFTISLAALTLVSVRYSTCRTPHLTNVAKYFESGIPAKRLQRMLFVCFCLGVGCWLLPLLLTSVSYFSGGGLDKFTVQAALGFLLVLTLIAHPLCLWGYQFLAARFFQMSTSHVETKATALANAVPDRLNHATKLYSPVSWSPMATPHSLQTDHQHDCLLSKVSYEFQVAFWYIYIIYIYGIEKGCVKVCSVAIRINEWMKKCYNLITLHCRARVLHITKWQSLGSRLGKFLWISSK